MLLKSPLTKSPLVLLVYFCISSLGFSQQLTSNKELSSDEVTEKFSDAVGEATEEFLTGLAKGLSGGGQLNKSPKSENP